MLFDAFDAFDALFDAFEASDIIELFVAGLLLADLLLFSLLQAVNETINTINSHSFLCGIWISPSFLSVLTIFYSNQCMFNMFYDRKSIFKYIKIVVII
ncbi:hypothetical protein D3C77_480270 [compost metagenome]